tara:strand:+ start:457 stop:606 length:150 start_codon:yes stop_codon:yes gene_type:complete
MEVYLFYFYSPIIQRLKVKKFVVDIGWGDNIVGGTFQPEKLLHIIRLKA